MQVGPHASAWWPRWMDCYEYRAEAGRTESKPRFNSAPATIFESDQWNQGLLHFRDGESRKVTNGVTNLRGSADLHLGSPLDASPRERTGGLQACMVTERLESAHLQVEAPQYGKPQHQLIKPACRRLFGHNSEVIWPPVWPPVGDSPQSISGVGRPVPHSASPVTIGFLSFGGETLSALQVTPSCSGRKIRRSREGSLRFEAGDPFA